MKTIKNVTPMLSKQANTMNPEEVQFNCLRNLQLSTNLNDYQKAMDELMIAGKIMDSQMGEANYDQASETGV